MLVRLCWISPNCHSADVEITVEVEWGAVHQHPQVSHPSKPSAYGFVAEKRYLARFHLADYSLAAVGTFTLDYS